MDIDRYIAVNQHGWSRLAELTDRARRSSAGLSADELDELLAAYQRVSAQLSYSRSHFADQNLTTRLTRVVAAANTVIYGKRTRSLRSVQHFFVYSFPAAVYQRQRFMWLSAALLFVPAFLIWIWLGNDPTAMDASAPPAFRENYVNEQFQQYYDPDPVFFSTVVVNNVFVSFLVFAFGIVVPVAGPVYVLITNSMLLGQVAAWMTEAGDTGRFLGYILPHGMLELTAIVVAGGASLALGWSVIAPGDRRRSVALREEGRRLMVVILGVAAMLFVSGIIEGFITGSALPTGIRIGIGAIGWIGFIAYFAVLGRAATNLGMTGAIGERPRSWDDEITLDDLETGEDDVAAAAAAHFLAAATPTPD